MERKHEKKSFSISVVSRWFVQFAMVSLFARLLSALVYRSARCIFGSSAAEVNDLTAVISMIARAELRGRGTALALQRSVRCSAFAES